MIGYARTLLLFYRRHLRVQPLRELMAIGGIAAGVALLFAVQVAHRSVTGSFQEIVHGVAGHASIELAARGPEGFDDRIAEQVERMPDVKAAAPIFEQPIVAVGPRGRRALTLVGATEQIIPLGGRLSVQFQRAGEASHRGLLVLTESTAHAIGARPGSDVTVLVGAGTHELTLDATVPSRKLGSVAESPIAAAPLPIVQTLAGLPGRVTRILIQAQPGREDSLRRALVGRFGATLDARPIGAEATLLSNAAAPEKQLTLLFSAISFLVGVILAYNALLLASDERRRFIVSLVQIGAPDSMIVASLAFDAFILGLVGCALGLLAGDVVSLLAYRAVPGYIAAAFAIGGQRVVGWQTVLIALAGGMLAACAAAALPALAVLRAGATANSAAAGRTLSLARKPRLSEEIVFACGALLTCISVTVSAIQPAATVVALVGIAAGIVICLPMAMRYLLRLARAVSRRSGDASAVLAVSELRRARTRSVALLATGTVAAFLMVLIGGSVADVQHAARSGATGLLSSAPIWIKPGGAENVYTTQPFAYTETQRRLQRLGDVDSVLPWRDSFLDLTRRRVWVLGVPPQTAAQIVPSQLVQGSLQTADRHLREGGWVAISEPIAQEDHLRLGERFTLPTPAGNTSFRLAATIANYGWLPGAIVMNGDQHARLWRSDTATELATTLEPGVSIAAGKRAVERALPAGSALTVHTDSERRSEVSAVLGSTLARLNDTTIVVLIATISSVIALMLAAIWQRRARLGSLMAIGMGSGQFARLVSYETGLVLLTGCAIGVGAGLVGQDLIDGWLHRTTGAQVEFAAAWGLGLRTVAIIAGISAVASTIAVAQAAGFQPRSAFSTE
jgi:putative ABC transport system permease protein